MNIITREYSNPLAPVAHTKTLSFTFDEDSFESVSQTLKGGEVWAANLASLTSIFLTQESNVLDVGAHIGTYSALISSVTKGSVISIEAEPTNFRFLEKNKELNGFDHWEIHNIAASNQAGKLAFCPNGPCSHVQTPSGDENEIIVEATKLDDLLSGRKIDFVKMDIEGHEIEALQGMNNLISEQMPTILIEVNGFTLHWFNYTPNDLIRQLEKFGYRVFIVSQVLIPINSYEPFPFGLVDCVALKESELPKISKFIRLPLSETERAHFLKHAYEAGNADLQKYFHWMMDSGKLPDLRK